MKAGEHTRHCRVREMECERKVGLELGAGSGDGGWRQEAVTAQLLYQWRSFRLVFVIVWKRVGGSKQYHVIHA